MADITIPELTELTSIATDDLLYIVDVSDTLQSAEGTSKKVQISTLNSGGGVGTKTIEEKTGAFSVDPDADNNKVFRCLGGSFTVTFPSLTAADNGATITFILRSTGTEVITFAKDVGDYWEPAPPQLDTDGDAITFVCYYSPFNEGIIMATSISVA